MRKLFIYIFLLILSVVGQRTNFQKLELDDTYGKIKYTSILEHKDTLYAFYLAQNAIFYKKYLENQQKWSESKVIFDDDILKYVDLRTINNPFEVEVADNGNILFIFFHRFALHYIARFFVLEKEKNKLIAMDFSDPPTRYIHGEANLWDSKSDEIFLSFTRKVSSNNHISSRFYKSIDNGLTWSYLSSLENRYNPSVAAVNNKLFTAHLDTSSGNYRIGSATSTNNGIDWIPGTTIYSTNDSLSNINLTHHDDSLFITWQQQKYIKGISKSKSNIFRAVSTDEGLTWSSPVALTEFIGNDNLLSVNESSYGPVLTMTSERGANKSELFYYGHANKVVDNAPPFIDLVNTDYNNENNSLSIRASVFDEKSISSVFVSMQSGKEQLWDDGLHNDSLANDKIYGVIINTEIDDINLKSDFIDINNFQLAFDNKGNIADVPAAIELLIAASDDQNNTAKYQVEEELFRRTGTFDDKTVLFSGGFFLSGYNAGNLWANAVAPSEWIEDYIPGKVNSLDSENSNIVYVVTIDDPPFGHSWQNWKGAVDQGAYFYDGDDNGRYNPVDLNGNGIWEPTEDRPDLLYDATYFTCYNDGLHKNFRRFHTVSPLGIEIRQTIFASSKVPELSNTIFVRYSLLNTGLVADSLNDVIFSPYVDTDLGYWFDDLAGADTSLSSIFSYNNSQEPDEIFGNTTPYIFVTLLQGGITDSDYLRDTAFVNNGVLIGQKVYRESTNTILTSHSSILLGEGIVVIANKDNARNYQLGLSRHGEELNPCNWRLGEVFGIDCSLINPLIWYSGDPVTQLGWIASNPSDIRQLLSTGPFNLVKDQPQDMIVAYTVGRGNDPLSSITAARERVRFVIEEYNNNFPNSFVEPNYDEIYPKQFTLSQNYPNPFNPSTKIIYTIPSNSLPSPYQGEGPSLSAGKVEVRLIVYDILGRKVKTLVNEPKAPGSYEVRFDASQLASGVYFYRITADNFVQTKKMILLR